jgi:heme-degrading monooxygenase HmoA
MTPNTPYYAVIFTSIRTDNDNGYADVARAVLELARQQPGFIGFESARNETGISVSYWKDMDSIRAWKENAMHRDAQRQAKEWYKSFRVRVCRVERDYGF